MIVDPTPTPSSSPTTTPITAPAAPAALIAVARDGGATLSWEAAATASTYTIGRSTTAGGPYTTIASGVTGTTYADSGLTNGSIYFYVVSAANAAGASPNATQARVTPVALPAAGVVRWPLSRSTAPDADGVRYPFGARRGSYYDFHAGIDIPAPRGTPVYAVMDGTVTRLRPDDGAVGGGNSVLVNHGGQKWTAYLHLDSFAAGISVGTPVTAGTVLGYVGKSGTTSYHLHLTYTVGLLSEVNNEGRSKNPMEILPHAPPSGLSAVFAANNQVEVSLSAHRMTVRWIILKGQGQTRLLDYYEVVSQSLTGRNVQSQAGIYIDASRLPAPEPAPQLNFTLTVRPDPVSDFTVERIILKDFNGDTLLDQAK